MERSWGWPIWHFGWIINSEFWEVHQLEGTINPLRIHWIPTYWAPLESWESQLSNGVNFMNIRCNLRGWMVPSTWRPSKLTGVDRFDINQQWVRGGALVRGRRSSPQIVSDLYIMGTVGKLRFPAFQRCPLRWNLMQSEGVEIAIRLNPHRTHCW